MGASEAGGWLGGVHRKERRKEHRIGGGMEGEHGGGGSSRMNDYM